MPPRTSSNLTQIAEVEEEDSQSERTKSENVERNKLMKKEKSQDKLKPPHTSSSMIQIGETEEEDNQSESCKSENMEISKLMEEEKGRDKLKDSSITESACSLALGIVKAGLSSKSSAFDPSSWVKLMQSLDGRDKITKVIQYSSRFLAYYTQQKRFSNLQNSLTHSRKAFRFGRSFIEIYKLWNLGIFKKRKLCENICNQNKNKTFLRNVYYNIRSNVMPLDIQAMENINYRSIFIALKVLGLMCFWLSDNVFYLISSGFLESSMERKQKWKIFSSQSYFFAASVGLYINLKDFMENFKNTSKVDCKCQIKLAKLAVALLKSCCDVLVFSNVTGVNLHKNIRGVKMHEGFHSLCGIISASTVLYNNFPDAEAKYLKKE